MILVLAALPWELAGLRRRARRRGWPVAWAVTGMGPQAAESGARRAIQRVRPSRVLGIGLCGGLAPFAAPGSLAVPDEVVAAAGAPCRLAPLDGLSLAGRMLSVKRPLATAAEKAQARRLYQAHWVDQEGYAWAGVCRAEQVPLTLIRWVLDGPEEGLPALRHPRTWAFSLGLVRRAWQGFEALGEVGEAVLCKLW